MKKSTKIKALLFDLGGVVLEIDWSKVFHEWSIHSRLSPAEIADRFRMDEAFQDHERGQITDSEYFAYLRDIVEYQGEEASFLQGWNSIFIGIVSETVETLGQIAPELPIYLLTNTNATHEMEWRTTYSAVIDRFNGVFVSSTMGCRKPDRKSFEHALGEVNVAANAVLFFDDTEENVEGAKAVGLQAVHVVQPSDIRKALIEHDVL